MRQVTSKFWIGSLLVGCIANGAYASVLFSNNLDTATGSVAGYTFGDVANASRAYVDGVGVGGTRAVVGTLDFPGGTNGFGGLALQYQNGAVTGNTSASLSDYTVSFDAKVNVANGGFSFVVQTWSGQFFGGTGPTQVASSSDFRIATPNVFQHFDVNLGSLSGSGFNTLGQTWQIAWQMNQGDFTVPSTGNTLTIDNIQLAMVPEPSTIALALLGLTSGLMVIWRKKQ